MSRSQFQSKRFILRHAWLNLWDERMTTGRINQVAIFPRVCGKTVGKQPFRYPPFVHSQGINTRLGQSWLRINECYNEMRKLLRFVVYTQAVQIQPEQTLRQSPQNTPFAFANTTALRQMPDRCMVLAFGRVILLTNDQASLHATYLVLYFFAKRNSKSNKLCPDSAVKRAWHYGFSESNTQNALPFSTDHTTPSSVLTHKD